MSYSDPFPNTFLDHVEPLCDIKVINGQVYFGVLTKSLQGGDYPSVPVLGEPLSREWGYWRIGSYSCREVPPMLYMPQGAAIEMAHHACKTVEWAFSQSHTKQKESAYAPHFQTILPSVRLPEFRGNLFNPIPVSTVGQ